MQEARHIAPSFLRIKIKDIIAFCFNGYETCLSLCFETIGKRDRDSLFWCEGRLTLSLEEWPDVR